ncbi:MAG: hypothetical protein QGI45_15870 [Myxococcota bacterium]|jgi:hypothetical protein|nr:hypothetical protein [Myxococcota bacterium]
MPGKISNGSPTQGATFAEPVADTPNDAESLRTASTAPLTPGDEARFGAPRQDRRVLGLRNPLRRRTLDPQSIPGGQDRTILQLQLQNKLETAIKAFKKMKRKRSKDPLVVNMSRRAEKQLEDVYQLTQKYFDALGVKYTAIENKTKIIIEPDSKTALGRFAQGLAEKHNVRLEYRPLRLWAKGVRGSFITGNPDKLLMSHAGIIAAKPTSTEIHEARHSYHKQRFHVRNQHSLFSGNAFPPDAGWRDKKKSYAKRFSLEELSTFGLQHVHAAGGLGVVRAGLAGKIQLSTKEIQGRLQGILTNLDERADKSSGPVLAKRLMGTCRKLESDLNAHRMSFYRDPAGTLQLMARNEEHRATGQFTFSTSQTKKSGLAYISCTYRDLDSGRRLEIPLLHSGAKALFWDSLVKLSESTQPEKRLRLLLEEYIRPHNEALMTIAAKQTQLYAAIESHKKTLKETLETASTPWTLQDKERIALAVENLRLNLRALRQTISEPTSD